MTLPVTIASMTHNLQTWSIIFLSWSRKCCGANITVLRYITIWYKTSSGQTQRTTHKPSDWRSNKRQARSGHNNTSITSRMTATHSCTMKQWWHNVTSSNNEHNASNSAYLLTSFSNSSDPTGKWTQPVPHEILADDDESRIVVINYCTTTTIISTILSLTLVTGQWTIDQPQCTKEKLGVICHGLQDA